jgi:hypothetical protein
VRNLSIILEDVDVVLSGLDPDSQEKKNLQDITTSCQNVLEELEKISGKYRDLESKPKGADKKMRRAWKRLQWEPEDVRDLRIRITSNIALLNALNGRIVRDNTSKLVQVQDNHENRIVLDWLTPVDFAVQQSDIISRRQEGTGTWFTDSPEFLSWVHVGNRTLFCPGIPGAGKTMVAAIAVDHLWKHVQNQAIGVAFVYCNYKSQADQTAANLASAILKQLIQGLVLISEPVTNLHKRHAKLRTRPSFGEIQDAIQIVVSNYSRVYVIIDALDECLKDHRIQLLSMLRSLQSNGNLNLMATSRFIPEVEKHFSCLPLLEVRANDSDVKLFVAGQMYRLPTCVQRDSDLQETIQKGINMAVKGM